MGWATEELDDADWDGDITFSLTGLTGPGDISVYYFPGGVLTFLWASSNGITGADAFGLAPGVVCFDGHVESMDAAKLKTLID